VNDAQRVVILNPLAHFARRFLAGEGSAFALRSGHLQMGAAWLHQGGDHVLCGGAEWGPAPVNEPS
jgi:hypothetical protein